MKFLLSTRTHWEEAPRSRHQVAQALALNHQVYFLAANVIGLPKITFEKAEKNLIVIRPSWPLSSKIRFRVPVINEIYQLWVFTKLKKQIGNLTVINFDHTFYILHKIFDNTIYYCTDQFIKNEKYPNWVVSQYHLFCEQKVIINAVFCVTSAKTLTKKLSEYHNRVHEIKLGAPSLIEPDQYMFFRKDERKKIRVVFVGYIEGFNVSLNLLKKISHDEKIELTIIGPYSSSSKKGFEMGTRFVGEKKYQELFLEVKKQDVCLVVYNDRTNSGTTPNKLWLYLALGKPVVTTHLSTIKEWKFPNRFIYMTKNEKEFIELILKAYEEDSEVLMKKRMLFAKMNTWTQRMMNFLKILDKYELTNEKL